MKSGRLLRTLVACAMAALALGCDGGAPAPEGPSPRIVPLLTIPFNGTCAGVGVEAILRGAPDDPDVAWLAPMFAAGKRQPLIWPRGDIAVFDPDLRIVDASGRTVLRDGDFVDGGCVTGADAAGPLLIPNPADAFRLECGPMEVSECSWMLGSVRYGSTDWPKDPVASFAFLDAGGTYVITLEDSRRIQGHAPRN
jgi:hypothetical protein